MSAGAKAKRVELRLRALLAQPVTPEGLALAGGTRLAAGINHREGEEPPLSAIEEDLLDIAFKARGEQLPPLVFKPWPQRKLRNRKSKPSA